MLTIAPTLLEPVAGLAVFAFAASITPGPNNLILAASGASFGFRETVPTIVGVSLGFTLLLVLVGVSGETLLTVVPGLEAGLRWLAGAYLVWLAWKIASARRSSGVAQGRPLTMMQTILFQFINPKAWAMAITAHAAFRMPVLGEVGSVVAVALIFALINLPCIAIWAGFGTTMGRVLRSDQAFRAFNISLGALTVASAALMFL